LAIGVVKAKTAWGTVTVK